ncbi:MAG: cytochrome c oxidase subunit 3 [Gemmatimonadales bacterium]
MTGTTIGAGMSRRQVLSTGAWGMAMFIATEAALFAMLLFSYFYLAAVNGSEWLPESAPSATLALVNTAILLLSSGSMWWAELGVRRGSNVQLRAGLLITLLLGLIFLSIQGVEYGHAGFTPSSHAYGSMFFTVTGLHGVHVAVGLLMNLFVQARAWRGDFTAASHQHVTGAAWYWHFVDAVWLAVFTTLYLSPRLL